MGISQLPFLSSMSVNADCLYQVGVEPSAEPCTHLSGQPYEIAGIIHHENMCMNPFILSRQSAPSQDPQDTLAMDYPAKNCRSTKVLELPTLSGG